MDNNNNETETVSEVSASVIYEQDKAQLDVQISTAKAFPRNIKRCVDNAIALVTMDKETAETCTYSVPRGGKAITGPSTHLAKILFQVWGNMRVASKIVQIDDKHTTSESVAFDLENNVAWKAEVKRSIVGKHGRFNDDMITVTGNAANSISSRNAIFAVIPKSVVNKVYNAAKQTITGDISDKNKLIAKRKEVVEGLMNTCNVKLEQVLSVVGKASLDFITPDDIVVLVGVGTAIKLGDITIENAFKTIPPPAKTKEEIEAARLADLLAACTTEDKLREFEIKNPDVDAKLVAAQREKIKGK